MDESVTNQPYLEDYDETFSTDLPVLTEGTAPCTTESVGRFNSFFIPIAFSVVFVVGLVGNGLVLLVLSRRRSSWHQADFYLLQLALADLLLCFTLPFWVTQFAYSWVFGQVPCKLVGALFTVNMYSSVFFLASISMDRYLAIVHAVDLYRKQRPIHTYLICLIIWSVCLGLSTVELYYRDLQFSSQTKSFFCHNAFKANEANTWRIALRLINMSLGFAVPLLVMIFCYSNIFKFLCRSNLFVKHKSLKVIVVLLLVFILCWAPYNAFLLVDSLQRLGYIDRNCSLEKVLDFGVTITECLGLAHCCLNPIIYAFIGVKFRNELMKLLLKSTAQSPSQNVTFSIGQQSCREKTTTSSVERPISNVYSTII